MEWKDVPGYEGLYQANILGEIRRLSKTTKPRILKQSFNRHKKSYVVQLTKNGKRQGFTAGEVVAMTFLGTRPKGYVTIKKNGLSYDNRVCNLAYVPRSEHFQRVGGARRKPVMRTSRSGEIKFFPSAKAAATATNMSHSAIKNRCRGAYVGEYASDGYKYEYDE